MRRLLPWVLGAAGLCVFGAVASAGVPARVYEMIVGEVSKDNNAQMSLMGRGADGHDYPVSIVDGGPGNQAIAVSGTFTGTVTVPDSGLPVALPVGAALPATPLVPVFVACAGGSVCCAQFTAAQHALRLAGESNWAIASGPLLAYRYVTVLPDGGYPFVYSADAGGDHAAITDAWLGDTQPEYGQPPAAVNAVCAYFLADGGLQVAGSSQ